MILEDRISRYLTRTKSSSFRPIVVQELFRAEELYDALIRKKHQVVCRQVVSVRGLITFLQQVKDQPGLDGILVYMKGPEMTALDLQALNLSQGDIAGAGVPVMWVMTHDQMLQVSGCPHLWSCRDLELYDGTTDD